MGTPFLNSLLVISTNDCCTLLLICLEKAFHVGSAIFNTKNFKCMVCLKKISLKNIVMKFGYIRDSSAAFAITKNQNNYRRKLAMAEHKNQTVTKSSLFDTAIFLEL